MKDKSSQVSSFFRDPQQRHQDFEEASLTYTLEMATKEASRCLNCRHAPCQKACPLHNDIPLIMKAIVEGDIEKARYVFSLTTIFSSICGRVCPHPCQDACVRGKKGDSVAIRNIERFVGYRNDDALKIKMNKKKVGIIGAGPAGLSCAYELLKKGYEVHIFEKNNFIGGALTYAIPSYRLPNEFLNGILETIIKMGANIYLGHEIKETLNSFITQYSFDAVFIASGADNDKKMGIPGEDAEGVYYANAFLKSIKEAQMNGSIQTLNDKEYVIVGGGNVAIDVARSVKRLGGHPTIMYRRTINEMPAYEDEIKEAQEEGVNFMFLSLPKSLLVKNNRVTSVNYVKMELINSPMSDGRKAVRELTDNVYQKDIDGIIFAISSSPNTDFLIPNDMLKLNKWGGIIVDPFGQTSMPNVWAAGDVVDGPSTVVNAIKKGQDVAAAIDKYIFGK